MVECSHYVIEEVLKLIESRDKRAEERFKSLTKRYSDDLDFVAAYKAFHEGDKSVVKTLKELKQTRMLESEGGTGLPFKDRRHFNE